MLPEALQSSPIATALDAWDPTAIVFAKQDRGELTLEIAPEKIVAVCGFLKGELATSCKAE